MTVQKLTAGRPAKHWKSEPPLVLIRLARRLGDEPQAMTSGYKRSGQDVGNAFNTADLGVKAIGSEQDLHYRPSACKLEINDELTISHRMLKPRRSD